MNEILGFFVLASPVSLLVVWLPFCVALGVWVGRTFIRKWNIGVRVAVGVLVTLFALAVPVADEIAGRMYFNQLCETKAGVKVYQTIELPAKYWGEHGEAKFYVNRYNHEKLRFVWPDKTITEAPGYKYTLNIKSCSQFFTIDKNTLQITDIVNEIVLGEYVFFRYWGGWIRNNFSLNNIASSCEGNELDSWALNIFRPAVLGKKGDK